MKRSRLCLSSVVTALGNMVYFAPRDRMPISAATYFRTCLEMGAHQSSLV